MNPPLRREDFDPMIVGVSTHQQSLSVEVQDRMEIRLTVASETLPTIAPAVHDDTSYQCAHDLREDIRTYLDQVANVYGPQEADAREMLTRAKTRRADRERDAKALDTIVSSSMSDYQTAKATAAQAIAAKLQAVTLAAQQQVLAEHATQQALAGDNDAAIATLATELEPVTLPKATAPNTMTLHHWKLVDASKLKESYLLTAPNQKLITAMVSKYRESADNKVGPGAIKYTPKVVPRRESRKRT